MNGSGSSRLRPIVAAAVAAALFIGVAGRLVGALDPPAIGPVSGSVTPPKPATQLSESNTSALVGFTSPARPTGVDPDSGGSRRLWFAEGRWWAVLVDPVSRAHHIWTLTGFDGPWVDTGVVVDDRDFARPSVVWTGTRLIVTSSGPRDYRSHALRVSRFAWNAAGDRWEREPDFPVEVTSGGGGGTQVAVGADGRVWLARLDGARILIARSDVTNLSYTAFGPLAGGLAGADVGGFSLSADGPVLRLVWRSLSTDRLTIATGDGTTWATDVRSIYGVGGTGSVQVRPAGPARPGALLVLATTTLAARGSNDRDPSIILASVTAKAADISVVAIAADRLSNAEMVIDEDAGEVHVVMSAGPPDPLSGAAVEPWAVTQKVARVVDPAFGTGQGLIVLRNPTGPYATPAVPESMGDASGLLVVASGPDLGYWMSAQQGGPAPGAPPPPGAGNATLVHDTFDQRALGAGAPSAWFASGKEALSAEMVGEGSGGGRSLAFTNPDGGPAATACRALPASGGRPVTVRADLRADGLGSSDTRVLTVKGPAGTLASVRITRKSVIGFSGPDGRVERGLVSDSTPLRVTVRIDPAANVADIRVERAAGGVLVDAPGQPLLSAPGSGADEVCFTPAPGNAGARLVLADLLVTEG